MTLVTLASHIVNQALYWSQQHLRWLYLVHMYTYFHTYVLIVSAICTIHHVYCKRSRAKVDVMCHNSSHASLNRS